MKLADYIVEAAQIVADFDGADIHVLDPVKVTR